MGFERNHKKNQLMVFERKVLRSIFGPTKERDSTWRIKKCDKLDELIRHKNIINHIKAERLTLILLTWRIWWAPNNVSKWQMGFNLAFKGLSWFGHLHRMPEDRMVKRGYKWKLMLARLLGRPQKRWEDDITNDMKKLKIKTWTSCIQDGKKWKLYVEKDKRFKEWSCSA